MSYNLLLKVFAFGVLAVGMYGVPCAVAEHTSSGNPLFDSKVERMAEECDKAWIKSWSRACTYVEEWKARMGAELQQGEAVIILLVGQACASELAELQQGEAVITRMGGLNAADGIRNGVNKSRGHIKGSNNAANDRDEARYWENAARAAWARGDRAAAEKAQAQFTYYQQRALQYSR